MNIGTKESLFQPGQPVSADRFKGREKIIKEILKYFPAVKSGNLIISLSLEKEE